MASYKVIQDIEAEDKFVGPLSLKQFVFAMVGALFAYLSFFVITKGLMLGLAVTLPPMFFGFFMAFPWSSEQPTDIWVLAKIRFRIKPKRRIWDQAGRQELVTITAPKKEEKPRGNGLSGTEVKSRLKALAETLDSRGWVIKNATLPNYNSKPADSSRLVELSQSISDSASFTAAIPDMMEEGRNLDEMIQKSDDARTFEIIDKMDRARAGEPLESISQPEPVVAPPVENITSENTLSEMLRNQKRAGDIGRSNLRTIPAAPSPAVPTDTSLDDRQNEPTTEVKKAQASVTEQTSPDILELAHNNALKVATIARRANSDTDDESKEVVISLH